MEEWAPIPGSSHYAASSGGRIFDLKAGCYVHQGERDGYRVAHATALGESRTHGVHRLILMAFRGAPRPKDVGRHMNGVKHDNRLENLAWGSKSENASDRSRYGLLTGDPSIKLSPEGVREIWRRLQRGDRSVDIAADFRVHTSTVAHIKGGRTWNWITGLPRIVCRADGCEAKPSFNGLCEMHDPRKARVYF